MCYFLLKIKYLGLEGHMIYGSQDVRTAFAYYNNKVLFIFYMVLKLQQENPATTEYHQCVRAYHNIIKHIIIKLL